MKQERKNEIDLLLRRMSRRNGDSMADAHTKIDDHHLDADELSSYAQNVLPPATRARYTQHLAECLSCRKLVTQLVLSLGATAPAAATVPAPSGLKAFLASLFSPMVLRYAVPALGLVVVAVIGFVVLRQQGSQEMASRVSVDQPQVATSAQPETSVIAPIPNTPENESPKEVLPNQPKPVREQQRAAAPQTKTAADAVSTGPVPPAKTEAVEAEAPPVATPEPARSKLDVVADKEAEKREERPAKRPSVAAAQTSSIPFEKQQANQPATGNFTLEPSGEKKAKDSRSNTRGLVTGGATAASRRRSRDEKDDSDERVAIGETRSIAGRSFRKERGIWIDTEYDSSTQTVSMARGSEQFRALIADEPAIGTIAKQLDGEVIVVWKGRAYRIR